ncbi:hypothetical protein L7F22_036733 [Adiantum nelumboides]|nr:hypothetical protein [Adiantum nelumboides]
MPNMLGSSQHEEEGQGPARGALDVKADITQSIEAMPEAPAKEFLLNEKRIMDAPSFTAVRLPEQLAGDQQSMNYSSMANGVRKAGIDSNLHKYAIQRLLSGRSHTGVAYNVSLPPSLQGITCQVMRLRAGSLHRRGLAFNNFYISKGARVHTGWPYVLMIYKAIPLSVTALLYSLPTGYTLISPILGLLVYTSNTPSAFNASSAEMSISDKPPITIAIPIDMSFHVGSQAVLCAFFDINGVLSLSSLSSPPNTCASATLLDMALVVLSSSSSSSSNSTSNGPPSSNSRRSSPAKAWRVALIAVLASFCGLAVVGGTVMFALRLLQKRHVAKLVKEPADHHETLHTSMIGHTRAPTAASVRTKPRLETTSLKT